MEISFPNELGYEVVARDAVAAFARCVGFHHERIEDMKTALSEACINAIEHGNALEPGLRVFVACDYTHDRLAIDVRDQGVQDYTPGKVPLSIAEKMAGLGTLRGMGMMLISELSDEVDVLPVDGGNCFRLIFYRQNDTVRCDAPMAQSSEV